MCAIQEGIKRWDGGYLTLNDENEQRENTSSLRSFTCVSNKNVNMRVFLHTYNERVHKQTYTIFG